MNPNFKNIAISKAAFNWLQKERKRTKLSIKVIVEAAFLQLSSLSKENIYDTTSKPTKRTK